jgi:hypothetical protein
MLCGKTGISRHGIFHGIEECGKEKSYKNQMLSSSVDI